MYDIIKNVGTGTFIPGMPKTGVVAFPFTMPTAPTGIAVTYYADAAHMPECFLTAHISTVAKDLGVVNPNKIGNAESILCQAQNAHKDKPNYVPPGPAFFNAGVAANNKKVTPGATVTFAFQSSVFPIKL